MLKFATWNVNSIKARVDHVLRWLGDNPVDFLCIQELKCETSAFPIEAFRAIGYHAAVHGQKAYNGVAILARMSGTRHHVPDFHEESRIIINTYNDIDIITIYAPNGNPVGTEKWDKKSIWMRHLIDLIKRKRCDGRDFILLGDYNIIPTMRDAANPREWVNDALYLPESIAFYRELIHLGLTDCWRALHPHETGFTFWDYQRGAWDSNNGIRIDHILCTPRLADRLVDCVIDKTPRGWDTPSDHVPVIASFAL